MEYYNEDGILQQTGGGGVSIDADGTQRALTAEELMEEINSPDVEYKEDGSVWVYFHKSYSSPLRKSGERPLPLAILI